MRLVFIFWTGVITTTAVSPRFQSENFEEPANLTAAAQSLAEGEGSVVLTLDRN